MDFNKDNIEQNGLKYGLFTSILIALGPVLWLFINISDKRYEVLPLNIGLSVLALAWVLFNLRLYLRERDKQKSSIKDILKLIVDFLFYIVLIAAVVVVFIGFYATIAYIQEMTFAKGKYITYMIKSPYSYLVFLMLIIVGGRISLILSKDKKHKKTLLPTKYFVIIVIILTYIVITSVVVVKEDGIYEYSFYNLKGQVYEFNDVSDVDTGFVDKGRFKGEFFYNIKFNNGKKLKLAHPSMTQPGDQYWDDTWQEYVHIDELIMSTGAEKHSSEKGSEHIMMDQIYIDKLLKVVRNK